MAAPQTHDHSLDPACLLKRPLALPETRTNLASYLAKNVSLNLWKHYSKPTGSYWCRNRQREQSGIAFDRECSAKSFLKIWVCFVFKATVAILGCLVNYSWLLLVSFAFRNGLNRPGTYLMVAPVSCVVALLWTEATNLFHHFVAFAGVLPSTVSSSYLSFHASWFRSTNNFNESDLSKQVLGASMIRASKAWLRKREISLGLNDIQRSETFACFGLLDLHGIPKASLKWEHLIIQSRPRWIFRSFHAVNWFKPSKTFACWGVPLDLVTTCYNHPLLPKTLMLLCKTSLNTWLLNSQKP